MAKKTKAPKQRHAALINVRESGLIPQTYKGGRYKANENRRREGKKVVRALKMDYS